MRRGEEKVQGNGCGTGKWRQRVRVAAALLRLALASCYGKGVVHACEGLGDRHKKPGAVAGSVSIFFPCMPFIVKREWDIDLFLSGLPFLKLFELLPHMLHIVRKLE